MRAPPFGRLVVATDDPRARATRRAAEAILVVGELLVCGACTALALWPPVFGHVSAAGAVACVAFFLGVTPLGVALRDKCLTLGRT